MKSFFRLPKNQIIIILSLLLIGASAKLGTIQTLIISIFCLGFTIAADVGLAYIRKRNLFLPRSGIITGLILSLIIDPTAAWYQIAVIALGAMAIKNFIRPLNKHIFNPAASGLFIGWILFGLNPSWWAASFYNPNSLFTPANLFILIPITLIGYVSLYKYRRYYSVIAYAITYFILTFITHLSSSLPGAFATVLNIGTIFYMLLMLVEPMTSPIKKKKQALYGASVAALTIALIHVQIITGVLIFDVSLSALLLGNLIFFKFR